MKLVYYILMTYGVFVFLSIVEYRYNPQKIKDYIRNTPVRKWFDCSFCMGYWISTVIYYVQSKWMSCVLFWEFTYLDFVLLPMLAGGTTYILDNLIIEKE